MDLMDFIAFLSARGASSFECPDFKVAFARPGAAPLPGVTPSAQPAEKMPAQRRIEVLTNPIVPIEGDE